MLGCDLGLDELPELSRRLYLDPLGHCGFVEPLRGATPKPICRGPGVYELALSAWPSAKPRPPGVIGQALIRSRRNPEPNNCRLRRIC